MRKLFLLLTAEAIPAYHRLRIYETPLFLPGRGAQPDRDEQRKPSGFMDICAAGGVLKRKITGFIRDILLIYIL